MTGNLFKKTKKKNMTGKSYVHAYIIGSLNSMKMTGSTS